MARAKGFRSGRKKCQREVICRRRHACPQAGCEIGFSINGIRARIGLKCESPGSKNLCKINAVWRRLKRGSSLARCKVKRYLIPCVPAVGRVLRFVFVGVRRPPVLIAYRVLGFIVIGVSVPVQLADKSQFGPCSSLRLIT